MHVFNPKIGLILCTINSTWKNRLLSWFRKMKTNFFLNCVQFVLVAKKTDLIGQWLFYPVPYAQYLLPRGISQSTYSQNPHIIWVICIPDIPNYSQYCSKIHEFLNILKNSQIFIYFGFCVKPLANCMKKCFFQWNFENLIIYSTLNKMVSSVVELKEYLKIESS